MKTGRFARVATATMAALLLWQSTPGGMLAAYAANNGIAVTSKADELKQELAAKASDYPAGAFAFYEGASSVTEGEGDREIQVVRWGDTSAEATVDVKVVALTAEYGEDFEVYTKRGLGRDVLSEGDAKAASESEDKADPEAKGTAESEPAAETADGAAAETGAAEDAAESEQAEEKVPFAAADAAAEGGSAQARAETEADPEVEQADAAAAEDGISSMREAYAIQTGNDTKRTTWRGEYEESLAPVAAVETANHIASALPGASATLTFEPGEYVKTVYVSAKDDDRSEGQEAFKLMLGNASVGILGEQMQHNGTIEDNEEGEKIAFAMKDTEVTVAPGDPYAEVTVVRTSGEDYYAGAVLGTASGTATSETSYEPVDGGVIPFAAGATEQTVQIPLKDTAQAGTQFTVRLDADATTVDGIAETVVKIEGGDVADADASDDPATATEDEGAASTSATATEDGLGGVQGYAMTSDSESGPYETQEARATTAPRYEHAGIVYDGVTVYPYARSSVRGVDATAWLWYSNNLSKQASRIVTKVYVRGYTDYWIGGKPAKKNWTMKFAGRTFFTGRTSNDREHWYTEQFNYSYQEGQTSSGGDRNRGDLPGRLYLSVNTDSTNHEGIIELQEVTYYSPRYTVSMNASDYQQTIKGRNYTSTGEYTEFDVPTLSSGQKDRAITIARNGGGSLLPTSSVTDGLEIQNYEIYSGKTKVGETQDSWLTYSELNDLRKNHDDLLRTNKYKVSIRPVYKKKSATVTFSSQDSSAIAFSGDKKGGKGFKVGDILKAGQIDTVSMTAVCPTDQRVKPKTVEQFAGSSHVQTYTADGALEFNVDKVAIDRSEVTFKATYTDDVSLTYAYHPDEVGSKNAGVGAIAVYNAENLDTPVGVSNSETPLTLSGALSTLNGSQYVARVVAGDGFKDSELDQDGIPYSTRTIWTYYNQKEGRYDSVKGESFIFDPYYADEVVNYHFKNEQDDVTKAGVQGTVYVRERPLFSKSTKEIDKPAAGVTVNVGGENTRTDKNGAYSIGPEFNKSDHVSAFVTYDSLTLMANVNFSDQTIQDFYINPNEDDALQVTSSSITRKTLVDEELNTYDELDAEIVLLEDAEYTFNLSASGSAGMEPAYAEFYFIDKNGYRKTEKTQKAEFENGALSCTINPQTLNLEVGDSMTVKLFDKNGNGYFEHQTSVVIGEKASGLYLFNYEGTQQSGDSGFVKALGGVSMLVDLGLDAATSTAGTYIDEATGESHQVMYIGYGDQFKNGQEALASMNETIDDIEAATTSKIGLSGGESISAFGDSGWSFDVNAGVIYDMVMQQGGPQNGRFKFNNFLMLVDASAGYGREWEVAAGPANLTFGLQFSLGDQEAEKSGVSVKWHFFDPDDEGYFVSNSSTLKLLADENIDSKGYVGLEARVVGTLAAEFLGGLIGGQGELDVMVGNTTTYQEKDWSDYGRVILEPTVSLLILGKDIPLWSDRWDYTWDSKDAQATDEASSAMMRAINTGMSAENLLFTSTDEGEQEDYSYTENRSGWNGADGFDFFGLFKGDDAADEQVLQEQFLADSDIEVYDLGEGRYIAAFLDAVPGRDDENKMGAYYSVYNGDEWSEPKLLHDDGTEDQAPTISDAGDAGVLITWSSAARALEADDDLSTRLNTLDIEGAFFRDGKLGEVMDVTASTDADTFADTNPQAVCYEKDDKSYIKLYYTKSEFSVSSEEEGEVVGDLLNPDQLNLVREYDVAAGEWVDSYDGKTEAGIRAMLAADYAEEHGRQPSAEELDELYATYVENWYGQTFLDLAPAVEIDEQLDESGRWTAEPTITPLDSDVAAQRMVKDSDAIAYNGLGLLAYSLDKGGMAQTTGDQNLYLQIFNAEDNEYHHPIMISGTDAEISDIQFVRSTYKAQDGSTPEVTWLYWKEQTDQPKKDAQGQTVTDESGAPVMVPVTSIKRIDISNLVGTEGNLIKDSTTVANQPFYYVNKAADNEGYAPEQVLVSSTPQADEGDDLLTIGNFRAKSSADGRYTYTAWTQPVAVGDQDSMRQELQLFVMREDLYTGETSAPVQVTNTRDQYLAEFDFAVPENGNIDVLAARKLLKEEQILDENGAETGSVRYAPSDESTALVFMQVEPTDEITIGTAAEGSLVKNDEGDAVAELETTIRNMSFDGIDDVNIEAVDAAGEVVYSSKDETYVQQNVSAVEASDGGVTFEGEGDTVSKRGLITLGGGEDLDVSFRVPVDATGAYDVTLRVVAGDSVLATQRIRGQVPVKLACTTLSAEVAERDRVELSAAVANDTVLASGERTVAYGYVDADGKQVELGTAQLESIEPGAEKEFSVTIDQDFAAFESETLEDGSLVDSRTYYLDLEPDEQTATASAAADEGVTDEGDSIATVVYGTVELRANASQVALMAKTDNLGAVLTQDDGEGGIEQVDGVKNGGYADLGLTVDGTLAQGTEEFINGLKVVWNPVDNDVATVDENGLVYAKKKGAVKLTGTVMPVNTGVVLGEGTTPEEVDNYDTLPASLIKTVEVTLNVGSLDGGSEDNGDNAGGGGDNADGSGGAADGNAGGNVGGADSNAGGRLPGTGDALSPLFLTVVIATGTALVATGAYMRRRSKRKEA